MSRIELLFFSMALIGAVSASPSAIEAIQDMYKSCYNDFSVGCIKPKAFAWVTNVAEDPVIKITEDLVVVKKDSQEDEPQVSSRTRKDIFDVFEDFIQTHDLVAKVPQILRPDGPLKHLIPRSFQPEDVSVPLAATGRSKKIMKKVFLPFLLGLKFKALVFVPIMLALIALKTWKALTLGLLSFVLTGIVTICKLTASKATSFEVIHVPQHHEHYVEHPVPTGWDQTGGRKFSDQRRVYSAHLN